MNRNRQPQFTGDDWLALFVGFALGGGLFWGPFCNRSRVDSDSVQMHIKP